MRGRRGRTKIVIRKRRQNIVDAADQVWKCRKSGIFDLRDAWRLQGVQGGCSRFCLVTVNRAIVGALLLSGLDVEP